MYIISNMRRGITELYDAFQEIFFIDIFIEIFIDLKLILTSIQQGVAIYVIGIDLLCAKLHIAYKFVTLHLQGNNKHNKFECAN